MNIINDDENKREEFVRFRVVFDAGGPRRLAGYEGRSRQELSETMVRVERKPAVLFR